MTKTQAQHIINLWNKLIVRIEVKSPEERSFFDGHQQLKLERI